MSRSLHHRQSLAAGRLACPINFVPPRSSSSAVAEIRRAEQQFSFVPFQKAHHGIAVSHKFSFVPSRWQRECVAPRVTEHEQATRGEHARKIFIVEQSLRKRFGAARNIFLAIRRI